MPAASINRRRFAQLLGAGAAYVAVRPQLSFGHTFPVSPTFDRKNAAKIVRLSSNENPYGPSPLAIKAMTDSFSLAWRYPDEHADILVEMLAKENGVNRDQILLGNGSGEILKLCAAAFTGPISDDDRVISLARTRGPAVALKLGQGKLVVADPSFEAIINHAPLAGAEVVKVPLTASFAHDLPKMLAAARKGLIYICNPNNPTASITPKNELRGFIARCPSETMILVDEAYHHYVDGQDYESVAPLIKQHPNLIVARTFSKIYGMAGLRCGFCIAQPETIRRLRPHQTWDSVNIMALAAAIASLKDTNQVTTGSLRNRATRAIVSRELEKMGYKHIPSQGNFIMIDVRRPVLPLISAMRERGVEVGRLFPSLPNHMRVTVGRRAEMETFLTEFQQVVRTVTWIDSDA